MKIIISPAKKMKIDTDSFPVHALPRFLPQTEELLTALRGMSYGQLKQLWKCNSRIATEHFESLQNMDLYHHLTPAVLSYAGIQYRYMAPGVFTRDEFDYIETHLRILSGFYGLLRPFDGVTPYRLEMRAKLSVGGKKNLYAFWGSRLAESLLCQEDRLINLASREYSRCVANYLPKKSVMLNCIFAEQKGGKLIETGTLCKMARGEMVRWMAVEQAESADALKEFQGLGYRFSITQSDSENYVFLKEYR